MILSSTHISYYPFHCSVLHYTLVRLKYPTFLYISPEPIHNSAFALIYHSPYQFLFYFNHFLFWCIAPFWLCYYHSKATSNLEMCMEQRYERKWREWSTRLLMVKGLPMVKIRSWLGQHVLEMDKEAKRSLNCFPCVSLRSRFSFLGSTNYSIVWLCFFISEGNWKQMVI